MPYSKKLRSITHLPMKLPNVCGFRLKKAAIGSDAFTSRIRPLQ